jgi:hypothetical protein
VVCPIASQRTATSKQVETGKWRFLNSTRMTILTQSRCVVSHGAGIRGDLTSVCQPRYLT